MAIGRIIRPEVIVAGDVAAIQDRVSRKSGEVFKHDVIVQGANGGQVTVEYWVREGESLTLPDVGRYVALVAEAADSQTYGSSLAYARDLSAGDLDFIHSNAFAAAKAA
jgi:hypothetical protein